MPGIELKSGVRMLSPKTLSLAGIAALCLATAAHAEDASRWFVHVGPADMILAPKVKLTAGGAAVPGAAVSIPNAWTVEGEIGYFITPNIAAAFAGGYPPVVTVNGAGSLSALGKVGQMQAGPSAINLSYHFLRSAVVQPYVGAGMAFMIVWNTHDGALTNLNVDHAVGPEVQAGADVMIDKHWGAYVDYKRTWLDTTAKGMLGPAPVVAKVELNPTVVNAGVTYRF
jgi:outer membrane protein